MKLKFFYFFLIFSFIFLYSCRKEEKVLKLKAYPLDSMEGVITLENVELDKENSSDGKGNVWIDDIKLIKAPIK